MVFIANITFAQSYFAPDQGQGGNRNVFVGPSAGTDLGPSSQSTYVGWKAGWKAAGGNNTFIGARAGELSTGGGNLAFGSIALNENTIGTNNIAIGNNAARYAQGSRNISIGANAGKENYGGEDNICLGFASGYYASGNNNVFIGYYAGTDASVTNVSDQLYIQNSGDVETPLIYGDFATKQVGIGTSNVPTEPVSGTPYTLAVKGHVLAEEVTIELYQNWPDYVFAEDYNLTPLAELETEIEKLGHLPGVPSAEEVSENGQKVGKMNVILLEKVEELTLHLIDMDKAIKALQKENETLKSESNK